MTNKYKKLFNLSKKITNRLYLFSDIFDLKQHERVGTRYSQLMKEAWKSPSSAEDWVPFYRFLSTKEKYILVDIGANVGSYTTDFLKHFKVKQVLCYEPVPETFEVLSRNLKNRQDIICVNKGVSNKNGTVNFNIYEDDTLNSLYQFSGDLTESGERASPVRTTEVELAPIDASLVPEGKVVLKIDVQGMEVDVLEGCEAILPQVEIALIEVSFVNEYSTHEPSFSKICSIFLKYDMHPVYFQTYGNQTALYPVERDVIFVKKRLLQNVFS